MGIKEKLREYINDPENPILNFELALSYYKENHLASALNFFLRSAELTDDDNLAYQSLILCSNCLYRQGNRVHSCTGFILQAMALLPQRPEAWFLYLRILEGKSEWQECYTFATNAERLCDFTMNPLEFSDYPGPYSILFIKSKAAFQVGRGNECRSILKRIVNDFWYSMNDGYKHWISLEIKSRGGKLDANF
jgi:hypothetical protein